MGIIKEPIDVDFYVDPKPLTDEERELISQYILQYKENQKRKIKSIPKHSKPVQERPQARIS